MMGGHTEQKSLSTYSIHLDQRVRKNNPLRQIAEHVDFSFVRDEVRSLYGRNGNKSVDPEIILKMMFLLFLDNVKSERELMRIIPERLDYLWFLGYGLDDEVPHHSVLSKARNRWGRDLFEQFFIRSVRQCVEAGLVHGSWKSGKSKGVGSNIPPNGLYLSVYKGHIHLPWRTNTLSPETRPHS